MTKIKIMGQGFPLLIEKLDDGCYGVLDRAKKTITISDQLTEDEAIDSVIHEVIHAIFCQSGLTHVLSEDTEEAITTALENGLIHCGFIDRGEVRDRLKRVWGKK